MGRQEGIIPFTGSIGNIIFYKTIDGYLVRKKGGIPASRIRSDPNFARTRENNAEFGEAVRGSRMIRTAFRQILHGMCDIRVTGRLNGALVKVIREDVVNKRGQRTISNGDLSLLTGFNFNKNSSFTSVFSTLFTTRIDRTSGTLTVDIPAFLPIDAVHAPTAATHFMLKVGGAVLDFANNRYVEDTAQTAAIPLTRESKGPLQLMTNVTPSATDPLLLIFGVEFLQSVNDTYHPLQDSTFNATAVVAAQNRN